MWSRMGTINENEIYSDSCEEKDYSCDVYVSQDAFVKPANLQSKPFSKVIARPTKHRDEIVVKPDNLLSKGKIAAISKEFHYQLFQKNRVPFGHAYHLQLQKKSLLHETQTINLTSAYGKDAFEVRENSIEEKSAQLWKREGRIISSIPDVGDSNPISSVTNFCKNYLLFDVEFKEECMPDDYTRIAVIFKYKGETELITLITEKNGEYAKERAAKQTLRVLNYNREVATKYIHEALSRAL